MVWINFSICLTGWWEPSWLRLYRFSLHSWRLCSQLERLRRAFTALATGNSDTPIRYVCLMIKIFDWIYLLIKLHILIDIGDTWLGLEWALMMCGIVAFISSTSLTILASGSLCTCCRKHNTIADMVMKLFPFQMSTRSIDWLGNSAISFTNVLTIWENGRTQPLPTTWHKWCSKNRWWLYRVSTSISKFRPNNRFNTIPLRSLNSWVRIIGRRWGTLQIIFIQ